MFKNLVKLNAFALMLFSLCIVSCSDSDDDIVPENYGAEEAYAIQKNLRVGKQGCFEVVYPISILLPDNTTIEVESMEDAKSQLQAWKENNPDAEERPSVVYPIEVITQDSETVSVEDKAALKALKKECKSEFGPRPRFLRACFDLVYPITITFPDATTEEVEDGSALKALIREWKQGNMGVTERPTLTYPLEITFEDGTLQTINSVEELKAAKKDCQG